VKITIVFQNLLRSSDRTLISASDGSINFASDAIDAQG
jgi:hypothetical protein